MNIYKLFMKLVRRMGVGMTITMLVVLVFISSMTKNNFNSINKDFEYEPAKLKIINLDKDDEITEDLIKYLNKNTDMTYMENNDREISDVLYYGDADYVLRIVEGFGKSLANHKPLELEKKLQSGSASSLIRSSQVDVLISNYINNYLIYSKSMGNNTSFENLKKVINNNLTNKVEVELLKSSGDELLETKMFSNFLELLSYATLTCFITVIGYTFVAMKDKNIIMREQLGNITAGQRFRAMFLGSFTYGILLWLLGVFLLGNILYGFNVVFNSRNLIMISVSFLTNFANLAIAYMIATFINGNGAVEALSLIVGLGLSFSSGIFTPIETVSGFLIKFSSVAPLIWQVRANQIIATVNRLEITHYRELANYLVIILLLTLTYLIISFVAQKQNLHKKIEQFS